MQAVAAGSGGGSLCCRRRGSEVVGERGIRAIRLNRTGDRGFIFTRLPLPIVRTIKLPVYIGTWEDFCLSVNLGPSRERPTVNCDQELQES